jgi:hypothetical protein
MRWIAWLIVVFSLAATALGARAAAVASAAEFPEIKDWSSLHIVLERRVKYPAGQAYKVEIFADGTVWYEGFVGVAAKGQIPLKITRQTVVAIVDKFRAAQFFALREAYYAPIYDLGGSETTLTFTCDGRSKSVVEYLGGLAGMPAAVTDIEKAIEKIDGLKPLIEGYQ